MTIQEAAQSKYNTEPIGTFHAEPLRTPVARFYGTRVDLERYMDMNYMGWNGCDLDEKTHHLWWMGEGRRIGVIVERIETDASWDWLSHETIGGDS